jgi:hypothetical protein
MALFGLLSALAFGGIRFAAASWGHAERRRLDTADMTAVANLLRAAIEDAYPAFAGRDAGDPSVAFEGGPDSLALVTALPAAVEAGVLARERFFLAPGADGRPALFMSWRLDLPGPDENSQPPEHRALLLAPAGGLALGYYGTVSPGQAPAWADRWSGRDRLPELVRVRIARPPGSDPWPDLVAAPKATTSTDCLYDQAYAQCRRLP